MRVETEPRPAELPLPGGREGATVRLHPLLTGELVLRRSFMERRDVPLAGPRTWAQVLLRRGEAYAVPVPAFLIEHPGAGLVLVDTGLHPACAHGDQNLGPNGRISEVRMTPEQAASARLRRLGHEPDEVAVVVMTHLHSDHASAVAEFPAATFVVDGAEWATATAPRGWMRGYVPRQFDHAFDWRTLDLDDPGIDSFATFSRAVDLFGDGSVRLLSTPGHTPGHLSVLVRLADREALLTADAAYSMRTLAGQARPFIVDDEHVFQRSLGEIVRFVEQSPGLVVIPGHDPERWTELDDVY